MPPRLEIAEAREPAPRERQLSGHQLSIDAELVRVARTEAGDRLRLGALLDALFERDGHHELGFSSIEAYVVERCQQSRAWGRETRNMARRLRERSLVEVRRALRLGQITWSMAEVLSRHATAEDEGALLELAAASTVRQMRARWNKGSSSAALEEDEERETMVRPTRWVIQDELVMLSASRKLVEYLNGGRSNDEALVTALLGEGITTLQTIREERGASAGPRLVDAEALEAALARMKRPERTKPEPSGAVAPPVPALSEREADPPMPSTLRGLDAEIVRCARALGRPHIRIGQLFAKLCVGRAWRALGYESVAQYAAERVGMSLSSLEHRVTLARRVERYPILGVALDSGVIGYEAALLVSRVLGRSPTRARVEAWIERAGRRTIKHLREEVDAVLVAVELAPELPRDPPNAEDLEAVMAIERRVQSGELLRGYFQSRALTPQMSVTLASPPGENGARRPIQLTISAELFAHWRAVEAEYEDVAGPNAPFVAFLCTSLWDTWLPFLETWDDKWKPVYLRDRHRCTSPVCERRDVTPHHVRFQAHGGDDSLTNVTSPCAWCHLLGIHRNRLRVRGEAPDLEWVVGKDPILQVKGREVVDRSDAIGQR